MESNMKKTQLTWRDSERLCQEILRQITKDSWRPDIIVGIGRGGLMPAILISQYLGVKMISLDVSLRDGGDTVSNLGLAEDAFEGQRILIVDDINDTGATFNWIMEDWRSSCLPDEKRWNNLVWNYNVRFAVVVDNLASKCNVKMDYSAVEINKAEDDIWIEFPWEKWWTK
jgi:xanthine phosphoribosyltransferase